MCATLYALSCGQWRQRSGCRSRSIGQRKIEDCSLSNTRGLSPDLPMMRLDSRTRRGQSQPTPIPTRKTIMPISKRGSRVRTLFIRGDTVETVENTLKMFRSDPLTLVTDADTDLLIISLKLYTHN